MDDERFHDRSGEPDPSRVVARWRLDESRRWQQWNPVAQDFEAVTSAPTVPPGVFPLSGEIWLQRIDGTWVLDGPDAYAERDEETEISTPEAASPAPPASAPSPGAPGDLGSAPVVPGEGRRLRVPGSVLWASMAFSAGALAIYTSIWAVLWTVSEVVGTLWVPWLFDEAPGTPPFGWGVAAGIALGAFAVAFGVNVLVRRAFGP